MLSETESIMKAFFESRFLKRVKRSGTSLLLGSQIKENIAEHSYYVSLMAIIMHHLNQKLDLEKLLTMSIIHDMEEVRTGDPNQINRLYQEYNTKSDAFTDMWKESKLGKKLIRLHREWVKRKSPEARALDECDTLAELILEKEYKEIGNQEALEWMKFTIKRLKTKEAKQIAEVITNTNSNKWWQEIKNTIRKKHGMKPKKYNKHFGNQ
jgi:putative hydrolase of HD superfamily